MRFRLFKQLLNQKEEYPGNIWGWRLSFVGLFLIVFLGGLMVYQHVVLDVPLSEWETAEQTDSIKVEPMLEQN